MKEIWYDIIGYEGLYQYSNTGIIKSNEKIYTHRFGIKAILKSKTIKQSNSNGYLVVTLTKEQKNKQIGVHRIIADIFIPNPHKKEFVNHKNGIRNDNRLENLEWVSNRENQTHGFLKKQKSSLYTGVCKSKRDGTYFAYIGIDKIIIHLGVYKTEIQAHNAYLDALDIYGIENKYSLKKSIAC